MNKINLPQLISKIGDLLFLTRIQLRPLVHHLDKPQYGSDSLKRNYIVTVSLLATVMGLFGCEPTLSHKEKETFDNYIIPTLEKARTLSTTNPDSAIVLCNSIQRISTNTKMADSLETEIQLLKIVTIFSKGDDKKAFELLERGIKESKNDYARGSFYYQMADCLNDQSRWEEAEFYNQKALDVLPESQAYKRATCNNLMGAIYTRVGRLKDAEGCLQKALVVFERQKNLTEYASVLQNIGNIYREFNDTVNANNYYLRCARIKESLNDVPGLISIYNNIGLMYRHTYPDSALYYYNKVNVVNFDKEIINNYITIMFNKANIYNDKNQLDTAMVLYHQVLDFCKKYNVAMGFPLVLTSFSEIESKRGNFEKAIENVDRAIFWCDSLRARSMKIQIIDEKIKILTKFAHFEKAYLLDKQLDLIKDSINSDEAKEALRKTEEANKIKVDLLKQLEMEKQRAKNQTQRMWIAIGLGAFIAMTTGLIFYQQGKKKKSKPVSNA